MKRYQVKRCENNPTKIYRIWDRQEKTYVKLSNSDIEYRAHRKYVASNYASQLEEKYIAELKAQLAYIAEELKRRGLR